MLDWTEIAGLSAVGAAFFALLQTLAASRAQRRANAAVAKAQAASVEAIGLIGQTYSEQFRKSLDAVTADVVDKIAAEYRNRIDAHIEALEAQLVRKVDDGWKEKSSAEIDALLRDIDYKLEFAVELIGTNVASGVERQLAALVQQVRRDAETPETAARALEAPRPQAAAKPTDPSAAAPPRRSSPHQTARPTPSKAVAEGAAEPPLDAPITPP